MPGRLATTTERAGHRRVRRPRRGSARALTAATFPALVLLGFPAAVSAQPEAHCVDAHRFVTEALDMAAVTEPDTLDDWRTDRRVPGCRVTAAGLTGGSARDAAVALFDALRDAGWTRTPDPRDAPGEASLRFRRGGADCLYSFYTGGILGTEAEAIVDDARVPARGEARYNVAVQCIPAAPAAPRDRGRTPLEDPWG